MERKDQQRRLDAAMLAEAQAAVHAEIARAIGEVHLRSALHLSIRAAAALVASQIWFVGTLLVHSGDVAVICFLIAMLFAILAVIFTFKAKRERKQGESCR